MDSVFVDARSGGMVMMTGYVKAEANEDAAIVLSLFGCYWDASTRVHGGCFEDREKMLGWMGEAGGF